MQSLIHLYNTALAELGGEQIPSHSSSLEDDTTGQLCQNIFPHILDTVLEAHEWGFAKKRILLAKLSDQEVGSDTYALRYALPEDCVRPIRIIAQQSETLFLCGKHTTPSFEREGNSLLCNVENACLLYVARVKDPRLWPAYFAEVLKWEIASSLAIARSNDRQQKQFCEQQSEYSLAKACAKDRAIQNVQQKTSAWQESRRAIGSHSRGGW